MGVLIINSWLIVLNVCLKNRGVSVVVIVVMLRVIGIVIVSIKLKDMYRYCLMCLSCCFMKRLVMWGNMIVLVVVMSVKMSLINLLE